MYNVLLKIKYDGNLLELARFTGCAPCQIIAVNRVKTEKDLAPGTEIFVPVVVKCLAPRGRGN